MSHPLQMVTKWEKGFKDLMHNAPLGCLEGWAPRKTPQVVTHKITPGSLAPATVPCWPHLVLLALGAIDSSIQLGVTCVPHRAPEGVADTLQGKGDVDSSAASGGALTHSV